MRLWLDEVRPEIIVIFPSWFSQLDREPERFPVLHRIHVPDNVAMAGAELVIYATPWTRPGVVRSAAAPTP